MIHVTATVRTKKMVLDGDVQTTLHNTCCTAAVSGIKKVIYVAKWFQKNECVNNLNETMEWKVNVHSSIAGNSSIV